MNVVSVFDGMSGGQIALKKIGVIPDKYFAIEIKPHAVQVTQENFPNTIQLGDINFITKETFGDNKIDLFIGGSPCQSFSRAGDGSGFNGKSKLFFEYARILKELKEVNPDIKFLLENVIMKKEWEKIITDIIGVPPVEINSSYFSAQKRRRLYWTNIDFDKKIVDKNILLKDILEDCEKREVKTNGLVYFEDNEYRVKVATKKGYMIVNDFDSIDLNFPNSKSRRGRVQYGKVGTLTTSCSQVVFIKGKCFALTPLECERLQNVPDNYTSIVPDYKRRDLIGDGWTIDVICHIFKGLINPVKKTK
ncbi:DNA methylase [Cellulophaga phage phi18:2]|uniref:DNA (cytosine-5-)-methyltransferase n=2 Tax=Cellulophaga phage phi18:1 TaxID=1327982 RepID=S0A0T2_9CAUD|nr:DNA methylase [Cellulophaga phage phi18:1]AGO48468.1 DNA methylase [Cellulophaga phage phi18:1]AGO49184.1 DNA methylase [Cellulophaga phage phi18:2]